MYGPSFGRQRSFTHSWTGIDTWWGYDAGSNTGAIESCDELA
jgi:hypothetical protein